MNLAITEVFCKITFRATIDIFSYYNATIVNPIRMGLFGAAHGWDPKKAPSLKSVTHILQ